MAKRVRGQRSKTQADVVLSWMLDDLTVKQAASEFNVSQSTIKRWLKLGVPDAHVDKVVAKYGRKTARESIDSAMADAQYCTQVGLGGHPDMRIHENKDGSLDAQLTVYDLPPKMKTTLALTRFGECARALVNTFNTWIQVGLRWAGIPGKVPDSGDRRYRGLAEGSTFYYSADRLGSAFRFAIDMAKNVERKKRRTVETMFIRLHWNPAGVPPKDWGTKPAYRAYKRKG